MKQTVLRTLWPIRRMLTQPLQLLKRVLRQKMWGQMLPWKLLGVQMLPMFFGRFFSSCFDFSLLSRGVKAVWAEEIGAGRSAGCHLRLQCRFQSLVLLCGSTGGPARRELGSEWGGFEGAAIG